VTIVVICPHCDTKFNLQPELVGKSMRCPNLECRQVFVVKDQPRPIEPPAPLPPEPVPEPPRPAAKPSAPRDTRSKKPRPVEKPAIVDADIVEAAVVVPPKVKELVWSEDAAVPPPKTKKPVRPEMIEEEDDLPIIPRRKKKKNRGPLILIGMVVVLFLLVGFGALYILRFQDLSQARLVKQAEEEYKKPDYAAAAKSYEKLAAEYPDDDEAPKYKFFASMCEMQVVVRGLTNRENPEPALAKFQEFVKAHKDSPFAKHTSGRSGDILDAGKKLQEDILAHAQDRVKAYQADRSKSDELERADRAIAMGRGLLTELEQFRSPEDPPFDAQRKEFDRVEAEMKRERARTAALAQAAAKLQKSLSDRLIQEVEADLTAARFLEDPEAQALIAAARGKLRELVKYEEDPFAPQAPPLTAVPTLLFVSPIGETKGASVPAGSGPAVFLAVARGILYALDEATGGLLWAVRVGPEISTPPTIARVVLEDGPTELAIVTSHIGEDPAVAAYVTRTGAARWYQPLPAPPAGPAVVVGNRAYVPIRDSVGTIYEYDLTTGTRRGRIRLGQPVGPPAVVRPGTGLIYAAADARRVYVIDVAGKDDDGNPRPPRCVQVIATSHPAGTLRTAPVMVGPDGDEPADRWMILTQTNGPTSSLIRAFPVLPIEPPPADGKLPAETPSQPAATIPLSGWSWYPPVTDGEHLAVVTDASQFRLFGVKQPGNHDKAVFLLPDVRQPLSAPSEGAPVRGLVFPAEESSFWVLVNGQLQKFRIGLVPSRGLEVLASGRPLPLGEATQYPQWNNRRDAVCLVVRSLNSDGYRAVLLGTRGGELRWQRQLGIVPAAAPLLQGNRLVIVARDGGLISVPETAAAASAGNHLTAPPAWRLKDPPEQATGPTSVAAAPDGKTIFTITPVVTMEELKPIANYLVRKVVDGAVVREGRARAPAGQRGSALAIAGEPGIVGGSLLLPLADGFVYRHLPGSSSTKPDTLEPGPAWSGEHHGEDSASCYITALTENSFLTSDGTKKLSHWDWPSGGQWKQNPATWELRSPPAGPGLLLPGADGGPATLSIADSGGTVWLFATDRPGPPLKVLRPGTGLLPAGRPTSPLVAQRDAAGALVVAYILDERSLVCIDPVRNLPRCVVRLNDDPEVTVVGAPRAAGSGKWLVTDLAGKVHLVDTATGKVEAVASTGIPGTVPAVSGSALTGTSVLTPLSDGSAVILQMAIHPAPAPEPPARE
jgi:hypothetical protein